LSTLVLFLLQYTVIDVTGENLSGLTTVRALNAIDGVLR
jgi:hypothetical protein